MPKLGKSKRGQATIRQSDYMARCVEAGCLACRLLGTPGTVAAFHHQKEGFHGVGMRAPHQYGCALCPYHHTDGPDSVHRNPLAFQALIGMSESELVKLSQKLFHWHSDEDEA